MSQFLMQPDPRIFVVGFSGLPGSGKNHMARALFQANGFVPVTLAQHFKVEAVVRHGLPYEEVFGSTKGKEVREYLRRIGTEEGRDVYGEDVWIRHCDVVMRYFHDSFGAEKFAFTDVRFPNENAYIREHLGGIVIRLLGGTDDMPNGHRSESYYDSMLFDATVDNSMRTLGSVFQVHDIVFDWMRKRRA